MDYIHGICIYIYIPWIWLTLIILHLKTSTKNCSTKNTVIFLWGKSMGYTMEKHGKLYQQKVWSGFFLGPSHQQISLLNHPKRSPQKKKTHWTYHTQQGSQTLQPLVFKNRRGRSPRCQAKAWRDTPVSSALDLRQVAQIYSFFHRKGLWIESGSQESKDIL